MLFRKHFFAAIKYCSWYLFTCFTEIHLEIPQRFHPAKRVRALDCITKASSCLGKHINLQGSAEL